MMIATATEAAPGRSHNEDQVMVHGRVVAVFDGVTPVAGFDSGCVHGVAWYVATLAGHLAGAVDNEPDAALSGLVAEAISRTGTSHDGLCDLANPSTPAATACVIRVGDERLEYLLLSDSYLVTDDGHDIEVLTDPRFERAMATIRREQPRDDHGASEREARLRYFRRKQQLTNTDEGYWVAAADPWAAHRAVTGTFPLTGERAIRRAALLTDGATRAVDTFALFGWRELLDLITDKGPEELIRRVREAEAADATKAARPRFKRHDDATVALCRFE